MKESAATGRERLEQLLVDRALEGVSDEQQVEIDHLLAEFQDVDTDEFDLIAAQIDLELTASKGIEALDPLPESLRQRMLFALPPQESRPSLDTAPRVSAPSIADSGGSRSGRWGFVGWCVAAAILVWVAMTTFLDGSRDLTSRSPRDLREKLLATAPDVMQVDWKPLGNGVTGDVVWSGRRQEGYLLLRDLPANDAGEKQYQLWIFDRSQDDRYPIDGGVFDVEGGETVIPISPKIEVDEAWQFAVTVEKPGGVVVSDREIVVALAN